MEERHPQGYGLRVNELRMKSRKVEKSRPYDGSRRMAARKGLVPSVVHSEGMTFSSE